MRAANTRQPSAPPSSLPSISAASLASMAQSAPSDSMKARRSGPTSMPATL